MAVAGSLTYKAELDEKEFDSKYAKFQNVLATGGKAIAASMAAAGAAIIAIGTNAIQSYADYEQLVGGAQLMFGDAYNFIADKAANAYATVQMSQNDYLQQVNGFAVGLKTALGGNAQAAAELADKIVTAEADVVAATGNSQEAVQAAFKVIRKSNFTMLDNLQLGIKPTKEGMQEVIDKVNEWNTANGKATSYQIDNLADCQSALVDYIEMQGIAGYAANEAADTIQGTLASVKGAWENLLTGLADDNADFEKYKIDLLEESKFNIKLLSIKVKRFMILTNKNGYDINKIIYPTSMYNYFLRDSQLDINGTIDKIEIIKGKYYPISYKFNIPPIQGVWDSDAIELACNSILIEEEFETDVYVGFVEYLNFAERRAVVIDANLRKSLFRILDSIKRIIINNEIPTVRYELNKCKKCEYKEICQEEFTNPIDV